MTVTGLRSGAVPHLRHEVAQNETQPLKLIRMREPYIDLEPVSAAPLKPAGSRISGSSSMPSRRTGWRVPEVRILHVETR